MLGNPGSTLGSHPAWYAAKWMDWRPLISGHLLILCCIMIFLTTPSSNIWVNKYSLVERVGELVVFKEFCTEVIPKGNIL